MIGITSGTSGLVDAFVRRFLQNISHKGGIQYPRVGSTANQNNRHTAGASAVFHEAPVYIRLPELQHQMRFKTIPMPTIGSTVVRYNILSPKSTSAGQRRSSMCIRCRIPYVHQRYSATQASVEQIRERFLHSVMPNIIYYVAVIPFLGNLSFQPPQRRF